MKNKWLVMFLVAGMSLWGASARANIDLKTWKNYANLAEQGAICASFSTLMEAQSVLNPDMGRLWQERRKFSGAVIHKAVMLEFNKKIAAEDIEAFIVGYRDWVLAALMSSDGQPSERPQNSLALGQEKIANLIKTQCAMLFKQGDEQIRQKFPELAYLIAPKASPVQLGTNPARQTAPKEQASQIVANAPKPAPVTKKADAPQPSRRPQSNTQDDTEPDLSENKTITLALGGGISFSANMPRVSAKPAKNAPAPVAPPKRPTNPKITETIAPIKSSPAKSSPAKSSPANSSPALSTPAKPAREKPTPAPAAKPATQLSMAETKPKAVPPQKPVPRAPELSLAQQQATPLILPVSLALPVLPEGENQRAEIYVSFGDYLDIAAAEKQKNRLEKRFARLFAAYQLRITAHDLPDQDIQPNKPATAPAYRLQTDSLAKATLAQEICTLLWPHNISCIVKVRYSS